MSEEKRSGRYPYIIGYPLGKEVDVEALSEAEYATYIGHCNAVFEQQLNKLVNDGMQSVFCRRLVSFLLHIGFDNPYEILGGILDLEHYEDFSTWLHTKDPSLLGGKSD